MSKTDPRPPAAETDEPLAELLAEAGPVAVPPRLCALARRLEAALAEARARRDP